MAMKKVLTMLLLVAMIFAIAACGDGKKSNDIENSDVTTNQVEKTTEAISTYELVAIDNEEILVKVTGINPNYMYGYAIEAYVKNKSSDTDYTLIIPNASINGVNAYAESLYGVNAGEEKEITIFFTNIKTLIENDIGEFSDIKLTFLVRDASDWYIEPLAQETVNIYPLGKDKATKFVRETLATDEILVDNDEVTIIVTDYDLNGEYGYTINLYLVNKSEKFHKYTYTYVTINGHEFISVWEKTLTPNTVSFDSAVFMDFELEEIGVDGADIKEISFDLKVSDDSEDVVYLELPVNLKPTY